MANQTLKTLTLPINEENITYEINAESINNSVNETPLDIAHGGTGANEANAALYALGAVGRHHSMDDEINRNVTDGGEIFNDYIDNTAEGHYSHVEGRSNSARGDHSHVEGQNNEAEGDCSHAEGQKTYAKGYASHAEGLRTIARDECQHVEGKYNDPNQENQWAPEVGYAHMVGNGTAESDRKNAYTLDWNGNAWFAGIINADELYTRGEISCPSIITCNSLYTTNGYVDKVSEDFTSITNKKYVDSAIQEQINSIGAVTLEQVEQGDEFALNQAKEYTNIQIEQSNTSTLTKANSYTDNAQVQTNSYTETYVNNQLSLLKLTPGIIYPYAGTETPEGFLPCDGRYVEITQYQELYNTIGTTYNPEATEVDTSIYFYLPNLKGKFMLGTEDENYALGETGGEATHTLSINEMPSHGHDMILRINKGEGSTNNQEVINPSVMSNTGTWYNEKYYSSAPLSGTPIATKYTGKGQPHNNMPPYLAVNYIISTGQASISNAPMTRSTSNPSTINYGDTLPESGNEGETFYLLGNPDIEYDENGEFTGIVSMTRTYIWHEGRWC